MRNGWKAGIAALLCAGMLAGCGTSVDADASLVYVDKKGAVTSVDVENLDANSYDETEFKDFVDKTVEEYNAVNGKNAVKAEGITVEEGVAKLQMKYKTAQDYAAFNGIEFYAGTVVDSLAAGYTYDTDFVKVEDGQVTGTASKQEIYAEEGLKVVIIRANTNVQVEGKICYVSTENVRLAGPDSVSIRSGYAPEAASDAAGTADGGVDASGTEEAASDAAGGTDAAAGAEDGGTDAAAGAEESGSFETQVYTFIVYR